MSFYKDLVMQTQMNFQNITVFTEEAVRPTSWPALPSFPWMRRLIVSFRKSAMRTASSWAVLPAFLRLAAAISTMKTTIPSRNTSASSRKSTTSTAPSTACSVTGMTVRLSGHSLRHSFIRRSLRPYARRTMIWTPCSRVRISSSSRRTRIRSSSNSIRKIKLQSCRATTVSSSAPPAARMTRGMPCSR